MQNLQLCPPAAMSGTQPQTVSGGGSSNSSSSGGNVRHMFVPPLTPPSSDPGSPGSSMAAAAAHAAASQQQHQNQQQLPRRTTPPPPYQQQQLQQQQHSQQQGHPLSSICPNIINLHSGSTTSSAAGHLVSPGRTLTALGGQSSNSILANAPANGSATNHSTSNSVQNSSNTRGGNSASATTPAHLANLIVPTVRTVRYNRRNNPELEKRRIHHCDYVGKCRLGKVSFHQ